MENKIWKCEICEAEVRSEDEKRKYNWIEIHGGSCKGISVWLAKPRKGSSYILSIGFRERDYDFCSISCLEKALRGRDSI